MSELSGGGTSEFDLDIPAAKLRPPTLTDLEGIRGIELEAAIFTTGAEGTDFDLVAYNV